MKNQSDRSETKKAVIIGVICIATYLANYYLRNMLGVLTPQMLDGGTFTVEHVGVLSSTYMMFYAAGQLINGVLGDIISPKRMVVSGLLVAAAATILFPFLGGTVVQIFCYAILGFGLSMMRGPAMKIISENTKPDHARIICVFFSAAGFAGPLIASLFAMMGRWKLSMITAGCVAVLVVFAAYAFFTGMEKKNLISYKTAKGQGIGSVLSVFKIERFGFFMVIACIIEISTTSISFWIPTFLTSKLDFDDSTANLFFTAVSALRSIMPFVSLAIYRATKGRDILMMRVSFLLAALLFAGLLIAPNRWVSILLLCLALMAITCVSAVLWSVYIPGLGKTGKVSSVNGILDCTGYIAASVSNLLFAGVMSRVGWNIVFILWASIGVLGLIATLFVRADAHRQK